MECIHNEVLPVMLKEIIIDRHITISEVVRNVLGKSLDDINVDIVVQLGRVNVDNVLLTVLQKCSVTLQGI